MSATLEAHLRERLGSRHARRLRSEGRVPASLQGENKEHVNFSIDEHQFLTARRHHQHLFDLDFSGKLEPAVVRELQWDPLGEVILHVEFGRVVRGRKMEAEVELIFTGHPRGGFLNHLLTHVKVRTVPSNIPDSIEVAVDALEPGHPLFARDLALPEGVELALPPDTQIAVVSTSRVAAEPTEGEAGAAAPGTTPQP